MDQAYIAPPEALKKLKAAKSLSHTVYIYGATGYGKTKLVKHYLEHRRYTYLSCADGLWNSEILPAQPEKRKEKSSLSVVVIDDLHLLQDEDKRQEIRTLFGRKDIWLILISRGPVPPWLIPAYVRTGCVVIGEEQFHMKEPEIASLLARFGVQADPEQLRWLAVQNEGNGHSLAVSAKLMAEGFKPGPELEKAAKGLFTAYLENELLTQWPPALLEFLTQVSVTDAFTIPMAEMVTGDSHVQRLLEMAAYMGNFLTEKDGVYYVRPILLQTLRHRAELTCGSDRIREYAYNAGLYYEMHDQILQALEMYEKSGRKSRIRELLIRNARRNPGNGHYYELRKYYFQLQEEDIENSAILMSAISMLYSMIMQPEKSEYWYKKLEAYEAAATGWEKQEAKSRLAYLDIGLPHRGSKGLLHIIKQIPARLFAKGVFLPEFCVTSNLPSTMNGGKDFCHWSKYDRELAFSVGKLVQRVLGRYGKGLVNAALGESLYEKGADTYEVLTLLSRAEMEAVSGGTLEIAFAAAGIRARLYTVNGDLEMAKLQVSSFEKRVCAEQAVQLLPNIEALKCRMALYEGDRESVERWMRTAPDENSEFLSMERYRYLTKVRCYLAAGNNMEALSLLEKLRYYAEMYHRTYLSMEIGLLTAIVRQRQGDEWQKDFLEVLQSACEYRFRRLISEEGAPANELLRKVREEARADEQIDNDWLDQLMGETAKVAVRYPVYLKRQLSAGLNFSENALMILRLQAEGLSINKIAERLHMKPETVRYHTKENYRKLGVSGKADAVLAARNLKLL